MKNFIRWMNKFTWKKTLWTCLPFFCVAVLAVRDVNPFWVLALFLFCVIITGITLNVEYRKSRKIIPLILIALMLHGGQPRAQTVKQPPPVQEACAPVIIGVVVIVIGGIVIYKVVKFCQKKLPPPVPPQNPDTNSPPSTNAPPDNGNFQLPVLSPSAEPESVDISTNGWMDYTDPANPVPFQDYLTFTFNSSTNLTDWSTICRVDMWLSAHSFQSVLYSNNIPLMTNCVACNPYDPSGCVTNYLPFEPMQPQLFIRDW